MRFRVILVVLTSCSGLLCDVITTTGAPETDFVDVLKRDLRRNNDDYIESTTVSIIVPNPYLPGTTNYSPLNDTRSKQTLTTQGTFYYRRGPNKLFDNSKNITAAHRRVFDSLESKSAEVKPLATNESNITYRLIIGSRNATTKVSRPLPKSTTLKILPKIFPNFNRSKLNAVAKYSNDRKLNRSATHVAMNAVTNFRSFNKGADKEIKKINKIKKFIDRNRQLFNEFMHKKRAESEKKNVNTTGKTVSESEVSDEKGGALRQRAFSSEVSSMPPEELDMASARGAQIHAWRIRGQLCYRHVLIPEGPKYDSRGKKYLNAYGHEYGRNYTNTRHPKNVLPKCCNCCKKSVLGCE